MSYEFSTGAFFIGLLIIIGGVVFVRFHQWVADNFGGGVSSYDRYKMWAFGFCGLGFVVMLNVHTMLLTWFFGLLFGNN